MDITQDEIDNYLTEIKEAIRNNNYRIERNPRRQGNINIFLDYVIVVSFHEQKYPIKYYFK